MDFLKAQNFGEKEIQIRAPNVTRVITDSNREGVAPKETYNILGNVLDIAGVLMRPI